MIAGDMDMGGTKIEASLFDNDWQAVETRRVAMPRWWQRCKSKWRG